MGWSPDQVKNASLWEWSAAWAAFAAFNGVKTTRTGGPTDEEIEWWEQQKMNG